MAAKIQVVRRDLLMGWNLEAIIIRNYGYKVT